MGAASDLEVLARALRNPGRLIVGPMTTTGEVPYGGTSLGFVSEAELELDVRYYESRDPASGALVEVARRSVEAPRIVVLIKGTAWDEDLLAAAFTKTTSSTSLTYSSPAEARIEGTLIPAVVAAWQPILFAAFDPQHKSIYFRRPVPRISLRQSVKLSMANDAGLPLVFDPTPDANWATTPYWQISRLENMTL